LWRRRFTVEGMAQSYRAAILDALSRPVRISPDALPPHLLADGTALAVQTLSRMGVPPERIAGLWSNGG
jgi:hypothetical protein